MQQDPVTVGSRLRTDIRGCSSVFSWRLTQCFMYQNSSTAPGVWRRQLGVKTCIAPLMPIYLWYIFLVHTLFMTGTLWYQHGNMEEHFYSVHTTDRYKKGQLCFRMRFAVRKIAEGLMEWLNIEKKKSDWWMLNMKYGLTSRIFWEVSVLERVVVLKMWKACSISFPQKWLLSYYVEILSIMPHSKAHFFPLLQRVVRSQLSSYLSNICCPTGKGLEI